MVLLAGNVKRIAAEDRVRGSVGDSDIALRHQRDAAGSGAAGIDGGRGDGDGGQPGGGAAALRTAIDDVRCRAIRRENSLDGMIEGCRWSRAHGKDTPGGQLHEAVDSEALRRRNVDGLTGGLGGVLDEHESDGATGVDGDAVSIGQVQR